MPAKPPSRFRDRGPAVRVLLAGPAAVERGSALGDCDGIEVAGTAATDADTIRLAHQTLPDVVLLDSAGGLHVLATARRLLAAPALSLQVLLLDRVEREADVLAALRNGVGGVLDKHSTADDVRRALRLSAGGAAFVVVGRRRDSPARRGPSRLLHDHLPSMPAAELVALSLLLRPDAAAGGAA